MALVLLEKLYYDTVINLAGDGDYLKEKERDLIEDFIRVFYKEYAGDFWPEPKVEIIIPEEEK